MGVTWLVCGLGLGGSMKGGYFLLELLILGLEGSDAFYEGLDGQLDLLIYG
jgi:hypothetical protein